MWKPALKLFYFTFFPWIFSIKGVVTHGCALQVLLQLLPLDGSNVETLSTRLPICCVPHAPPVKTRWHWGWLQGQAVPDGSTCRAAVTPLFPLLQVPRWLPLPGPLLQFAVLREYLASSYCGALGSGRGSQQEDFCPSLTGWVGCDKAGLQNVAGVWDWGGLRMKDCALSAIKE